MPNGGSDCCGTCWFNAAREGRPGPPRCEIRDFAIESPFYTYCANHPHKAPERITTPIGPVLAGDGMGNRWVVRESPDDASIRAELIRRLEAIPEIPDETYPIGPSFEQVVIRQLEAWREAGAMPGLERILDFGPLEPDPGRPFLRDQAALIELARAARARILGEPYEPPQPQRDGRCFFCGEALRLSPPAEPHLVRCPCGATLSAGAGGVAGGWGPEHAAAFAGDPPEMPDEPPAAVLDPELPGAEGPPRRQRLAVQELACPRCGLAVLDPHPGYLRRVPCPRCDLLLEPIALTADRTSERLRRRVTVHAAVPARPKPRSPLAELRAMAPSAIVAALISLALIVLPWRSAPHHLAGDILLTLAGVAINPLTMAVLWRLGAGGGAILWPFASAVILGCAAVVVYAAALWPL